MAFIFGSGYFAVYSILPLESILSFKIGLSLTLSLFHAPHANIISVKGRYERSSKNCKVPLYSKKVKYAYQLPSTE